MFSAAPMMKLQIIVFTRDTRKILQVIGESRSMQFLQAPLDSGSEMLAPLVRKDLINRCDNLLARITELRRNMNIPADSGSSHTTEIISLDAVEAILVTFEKRTEEFILRRRHILQRREDQNLLRTQVAAYFGLGVSLQELRSLTYLHFAIGSLPEHNIASIRGLHGDELYLLPGKAGTNRRGIAILSRQQNKSNIDSMLDKLDFKAAVLPAVADGTAEKWEQDSRLERQSVELKICELESSCRCFAAEIQPSLLQLEYSARCEKHFLEAEQNAARTESALLFTGWVPAADAPSLILSLQETTMNRCVVKITPAEELPEEEVPVLLHFHRLLRPFEVLLKTYGLPKYKELEPTLFLAVTYILMFGFMFGDAGQGAVLAIVGLLMMLYAGAPKLKDVGLLLLLGGFSSCFAGIVYGSYFGLPQLKCYALWRDPLEGDPVQLLQTAVAGGIATISLGLFLNMINRFKHGDLIGGILHKFGLLGVLFYWGALEIGLKYAAIQSKGLLPWAIGLFLVLPLCIWITQEPIKCLCQIRKGQSSAENSLPETLIHSIVGTFETVLSYVSNTISFVRLAAYAMCHAALLMATFSLAAQAGQIEYGGTLLSILIVVAGNLVTLALEGVVASVQALRLEYYEFFSKFYSGEGKPFKPFCP
jgi:V/A-type H+-transporting ATPase subunit I